MGLLFAGGDLGETNDKGLTFANPLRWWSVRAALRGRRLFMKLLDFGTLVNCVGGYC